MASKRSPHVLIVGAGLSGLAAALEIEKQGGACTIIDKEAELGGRVKTDREQGFLLDHAFQVLLSSYTEIKRLKLLKPIGCQPFKSGARCVYKDKTFTLYNPFRHPFACIASLTKIPARFYLDFYKLAKILLLSSKDSSSTQALLTKHSISEDFQEAFLRPFFGGVFLDHALGARSALFVKYLKLFISGVATLPAEGMGALPQELFKRLKRTDLLLQQQVVHIEEGGVQLKKGSYLRGDGVILSVADPDLSSLLNIAFKFVSHSVYCFYFSVPQGFIDHTSLIYLRAEGPISNLSVLNHIQPSYAPAGYDLLSATVIKPSWKRREDLFSEVKKALCSYFSFSEEHLNFLRAYPIKHALPSQKEPPPFEGHCFLPGFQRVVLAGEAVANPSINEALLSGRAAARALFPLLKG